MPKAALPYTAVRITPKQGDADCAVAALAMYLRRDHGEVLLAAGKVSRTVWAAGLHGTQMVKVGAKLGVSLTWTKTFDAEDDSGVLWVSYNDSRKEHVVFLSSGRVFDPDHVPMHVWDSLEDYCRFWNAVPTSLLRKIEEP